MKTLTNIIKLTRLPLLLLVVAIQLTTHYCIVEPMITHADGEVQMGTIPLTLCLVATVFIALGGFWVNDYFDVKIDRINRPITRVVDLFVSRDTIFNLYIGATSIAVVCAGVLSYIASCFDYFFIFVAVIGLLWFYSSSYKRTWWGSLLLAVAVAMIPVIVCMYNNWFMLMHEMSLQIDQEKMVALSAFLNNVLSKAVIFGVLLATWVIVIDIIRAMIEEKGEREMECHSLPIVYGHTVAKAVCYIVILLAMVGCGKVALESTAYLSSMATNYFLFTIAPVAIGLCFQLKKSKIRLDYMICTGMIYAIVALMIAFVVIFSYYYE